MRKLIFLSILLFNFCLADSLVITEIMYNPEGNDSGREWIEVVNVTNQALNLTSGKKGWRIDDGKSHLFEENLTIYPNEIFVIIQDRNKFSEDYPNFKGKTVLANFTLKNEGGTIKILNENKEILAQVSYQNSCGGDGNGYSIYFENGVCKENRILKGSPGSLEVGVEKVVEEKKDNNQTRSYQQTQEETTNNLATNSTTTISTSNNELNIIHENQLNETQTFKPTTLIINEFYPNPEGNDEGKEFVEIYNYGEEKIDLDGFILEIGKKKIKLKGSIDAGEYYLVTNKDYSFSIRNKGETLALYYQNQKIYEINYQGKAPEGKSFSRKDKNDWQFTQPTPGKENVFDLKETQVTVVEKNLTFEGNNQLNFENNIQLADIQSINKFQQTQYLIKNKNLIIFALVLILISILSFLVWFFLKRNL